MDRDDQGAGPVPLDHRLPGELEISRQHRVSRITVRRTMEMLTADGLVDRRRGRGAPWRDEQKEEA